MFNIIILGITSLLTDISSEMVYPLLPLYLSLQLGVTPAIIGLIEGIAESLASLLKVFSGYFSDKLQQRKPLTIVGYACSTIGKFFLYFSAVWGHILAGRIVDRFGKGVRTAPRDALIADSSDVKTRGRAYGLHRAMDSLGATIGVVLAYYFLVNYQHNQYKTVFLWSIIPAVLGVVALLFVKERVDKSTPTRRDEFTHPINIFKQWQLLDRKLKMFLILTFIFTLGNSSNQFLLLRANNLGFNVSNVILLYLVYNLVYTIFSYPAGRISDKIGQKPLLIIGYIFYGLVYSGFAIANSSTHLWLLFGIYGLYIAFTEGVEKAFVSELAPPHLRATMIGLHATLVGIGLFPASLIAGLLWDTFGPQVPFYFGSIMGLIAAVGLLFLI